MASKIREILLAITNNEKISEADKLVKNNFLHSEFKKSKSSSLPPILIANFQEPTPLPPPTPKTKPDRHKEISYAASFELLSLAIRQKFLPIKISKMPDWLYDDISSSPYKSEDIAAAVKKSISEGTTPGQTPNLKLIGIHIEGDLDLSKIEIPYLSLIHI